MYRSRFKPMERWIRSTPFQERSEHKMSGVKSDIARDIRSFVQRRGLDITSVANTEDLIGTILKQLEKQGLLKL
jgi:hypothetical protein